ncbi:Protein phosphatase 1 regulatory subunit [Zostera marina]|uniref:Protein phosphatase 1 regulatory subunit n=1 Tax=Zostera marina TaxID=29655 RepID=A0A0K9PVK5_ZOSMR|nr:Protein phosphatase 1 regulatory subunit [Zostera marina]
MNDGEEYRNPNMVGSEEEEDTMNGCLDLTGFQLHDLSEVDIPETLVELDLTTNRLSIIDPRIGLLTCLKKLSFRQNLLKDDGVSPISNWAAISGLEELIFRDNHLKNLPDVSIFKSLLVFDVSYNEIFSLSGLSNASNTIKEFYASKNEITKMVELDHLHELQILELGSNHLRVMECLENMKNLQELWLGRNRIKTVNLCGLKCIKKISLQSNRLTSMTGFQECHALEELYLSHNGIAKMEGLSGLQNLHVLDVSSNKLTSVDDIEKLTMLDDLWLNDNQIATLDGFGMAVAGSRERLTTIYLERNPCARLPNYATTLREVFSNLLQIDSDVLS